MSNTKNSNAKFQDFASCDLNLHWSWSNFNRHMITCNALNRLREKSVVVEFGANDSPVSEMMLRNFGRHDIAYIKTDCKEVAKNDESLIAFDLNKCDEVKLRSIMDRHAGVRKADAFVLCEVIEHLECRDTIYKVRDMCYNNLRENGMLIISTPTPPFDGLYDDRVWPDDHEFEHIKDELQNVLNRCFKVERAVGWSVEEREYNSLLEDSEYAKLYTRLRGKMPESFVRALIPILLRNEDTDFCRQVTFICKKRRVV